MGAKRQLSAAVSVGAHLAIGLVLLNLEPGETPLPVEPQAVRVSIVPPPEPPAPPAPEPSPAPTSEPAAATPEPAAAAAPKPTPTPVKPRTSPRPTPAKPEVEPLPAIEAAAPAPIATVSDAALAGALTAGAGEGAGSGGGGGDGSGGGGGRCDMVRRLQDALRRDSDVRAAAARVQRSPEARGRAILVWNGDWIRNGVQEGKGLAGVRQAISLEVAFAPEACRNAPVNGLVLISLDDRADSARLVLGGGAWRWTDLLGREVARRGGG